MGVSHDSEDYTNAIEYLTIDLEDGVKSCTSSISEKEWTLERSNNKSHGADDKSTSCYPPDAMINNENYAPVPDIQITKKTKKATKAVKHQQKKRPEVQVKKNKRNRHPSVLSPCI